MREYPPNCIGFVYYALGLKPQDKFIRPPDQEDLLKSFVEVASFEEAQVVAFIKCLESLKSWVLHMALVDSIENKTVRERRKTGESIRIVTLDESYEYYDNWDPPVEKKYLRLK